MVWEKHLLTLTNLVLVTVGVYLLVGTFYTAVGHRMHPASTAAAPPADMARTHPGPAAPAVDIRYIRSHNLFEQPGDAGGSQPAAIDVDALAPTRLNLQLLGTVIEASNTYAVIQDKRTRRQDLYRVGDHIQDATVKLILRGKAVLTVNGRDEVLAMSEESTGAAPGASSPPPVASRPRSAVPQNISLDRTTITEAVANVNELLRQVRIRPHFDNGKPAGLSLTRIRPDSLLHRMGLTNGDIIQKVDGTAIRSVPDVVNLYQKLGASSEVSVEIKRDGTPMRINYQIN